MNSLAITACHYRYRRTHHRRAARRAYWTVAVASNYRLIGGEAMIIGKRLLSVSISDINGDNRANSIFDSAVPRSPDTNIIIIIVI